MKYRFDAPSRSPKSTHFDTPNQSQKLFQMVFQMVFQMLFQMVFQKRLLTQFRGL